MIALVLAALLAWGQLHALTPATPDAGADAMTDALRLGDPAQREHLLRLLGIQAEVARQAALEKPQSGLRVERLGSAEVLYLPCESSLKEAHLYLLRQQGGHWRATDDAGLDCWWKPSSYELVFVPGRAGALLLAHHVTAAHGTGLIREEMKLLAVHGDRWATMLTTTEYQSEDIAGEDLTIEQTATLQPFPNGSLEETRATTRLGNPGQPRKLKVERRRWHWSAAKSAFVPGSFLPAR